MNDDIITIISRDGKDKIACYKYMEEYFSQLGKEKSFLMAPAAETANILRKRLKQALGHNTNGNVK